MPAALDGDKHAWHTGGEYQHSDHLHHASEVASVLAEGHIIAGLVGFGFASFAICWFVNPVHVWKKDNQSPLLQKLLVQVQAWQH